MNSFNRALSSMMDWRRLNSNRSPHRPVSIDHVCRGTIDNSPNVVYLSVEISPRRVQWQEKVSRKLGMWSVKGEGVLPSSSSAGLDGGQWRTFYRRAADISYWESYYIGYHPRELPIAYIVHYIYYNVMYTLAVCIMDNTLESNHFRGNINEK